MLNIYGVQRLFVILFLISSFTFIIGQTTVDLFPLKDNTLYEDATGNLSNGVGRYAFCGTTGQGLIRRTLIAFDIGVHIPSGATITDVQLILHMSRASNPTENRTHSLHPLTKDWGEGTSNASGEEGGGVAATTGDATWLHTFFNTELWTNPGGDFSLTPSASQTVSGIDFYTWGSTAEMVSDVQSWLDNPNTNFGWILIGEEETSRTAKRFDSKENPIANNRPVLRVTYTEPTAIEDLSEKPNQYFLSQNYPNPFNPVTNIRFQLSSTSDVNLTIFNLMGERIKQLVKERKSAGIHYVEWDGTNDQGAKVASGVYLYRMVAGDFVKARKMVLMK